MSTESSEKSTRSRTTVSNQQNKSFSGKIVINSLPFHIQKQDVMSMIRGKQALIERLEIVNSPESNQIRGKRCILKLTNKEEFDSFVQRRYIRYQTPDGLPVFAEIEVLEKKRQPNTVLKKPVETDFLRISKKVIFIENIKKIRSRKDFIKKMDIWGILDQVEIFIFKVDKDGNATGNVRVLLRSEEEAENAYEKMERLSKLNSFDVFYYKNGDRHFDFKLSKEIEMEKKKIQRKLKKLLKVPKTPRTESVLSLLSEIRKERRLESKIFTKKRAREQRNLRINWMPTHPRTPVGWSNPRYGLQRGNMADNMVNSEAYNNNFLGRKTGGNYLQTCTQAF